MATTRDGVTLDSGSIQVNNTEIGRIDLSHKHGYHPAYKLTIHGNIIAWFELDTIDLIDKVFDTIFATINPQ
jgi:hypothetical protein